MAAIPPRKWCVPGFNVGFSCWQAGYLAVGAARLVVVRRIHVFEFLPNFYICYYGHFVHELNEQIVGWPRKEVGIPTVAHLTQLIIENCHLMPKMSIHMGKKISSHSVSIIKWAHPHVSFLNLLISYLILYLFKNIFY